MWMASRVARASRLADHQRRPVRRALAPHADPAVRSTGRVTTVTAPFSPQADPRASYLAHRDEIDAAIQGVLHGGTYILGKEVREFEREFGAYNAGAHAIGVANGTDALIIALRACG